MRKRNTIRLNESTLKRIIKESVKRVLKESEFLDDSEYMDDGDLEPQYDKFPHDQWDYGTNLNPNIVAGLDPHSIYRTGQGNKKQIIMLRGTILMQFVMGHVTEWRVRQKQNNH